MGLVEHSAVSSSRRTMTTGGTLPTGRQDGCRPAKQLCATSRPLAVPETDDIPIALAQCGEVHPMPGVTYLRGSSLTLRTIEEEDIDFLQQMINDPALWRGFGAPGPRNRREMEERFEEQNTGEAFLICRDETPQGRIRLVDVDETWGNAELTCFIAPESQRQGLATEACRLVIEYGFDYLPINRITARIFDSNRPSMELADSLGFDHEGTLRDHVFHAGEYVDMRYYGLLEDDWRSERS